MTTGYVALAAEGFILCGPSSRTDEAVLQCIESTVTGVQYCFYSLGTREVQTQFDAWMERFVKVREVQHSAEQKTNLKRVLERSKESSQW